jgi:hypothetical protein
MRKDRLTRAPKPIGPDRLPQRALGAVATLRLRTITAQQGVLPLAAAQVPQVWQVQLPARPVLSIRRGSA